MRLQTRGFQQTDRFRGDCHAPCWGWCLVICALIGYVGKLDLASSGPFSAWPHPAASTIEQTSPVSPSLPGEKMARSRADEQVFRQSHVWFVTCSVLGGITLPFHSRELGLELLLQRLDGLGVRRFPGEINKLFGICLHVV